MTDSRTGKPAKPTKAELADAVHKTVSDLVAPGLRVLFCGINPGLYTAAIGHHFGRPGNRFWPALHGSGFTKRLLQPWEERELLPAGLGITNVVSRATATAAELNGADYAAGGIRLRNTVLEYEPRVLAVLGVGAFRSAFSKSSATLGPQDERIGQTLVWVLPNPSGLNANYQLPDLIRLFSELRAWVESDS
ncbi:MAG: G/U mismatch-specific DNA glycosylase [Phycisphaerae bacterium]|nr:G/U mismatch-specific DNA glycosylase [Gemmatimonadaceae bacterium]